MGYNIIYYNYLIEIKFFFEEIFFKKIIKTVRDIITASMKSLVERKIGNKPHFDLE